MDSRTLTPAARDFRFRLTRLARTALMIGVALPAAALAQDAGQIAASTPSDVAQSDVAQVAPAPGITLDPIVISAGFSPLEALSYGRASTTLDGEDLRERGILSVVDALRTVPSLAITTSGPGFTEIRTRGAEANHTMILIDGIEAGAGDGQYILTGLDTANVERIEVLRGPQSVFYGASAAAGVINIITERREQGTRAGFEVGNGAASWLSTGISGERGRLSFSGSARHDRGYDVSGDGGEDDSIRRNTATLSGDLNLTPDARLGFSVRRADEHFNYDANAFSAANAAEYVVDSDDYSDRDELGAEIFAEATTFDGRVVSRLSWQETRLDLSQNGGDETRAKTRALRWRAVVGIDGTAADATQTLAFALDRRKDENSLSSDNERRNTSAAIEYRAALANGVDVQFGLRHDDNDVFGSKTSYALAGSWRVEGTPWRLHASAGTGTVNPDYFELLGGFGYVGNPDLEPEENRSFDLGAEATLAGGRGRIDLTYFNERLENEITFSGAPLADGTNFFNERGTSDREGVEIAGSYDVTDAVSLGANYTYLEAFNADGTVEQRRPQHKLALNATARLLDGRATLSGNVLHVRDTYDQTFFGTGYVSELPDYTVVNVAGSYDLNDRARITARVENLFDREYATTWGYANQDRTGWIGLESRW